MRALVYRALGLGDLLTAVPALRALRRGLPDAELALAAPAWLAPIARLAGVDTVVDTSPLAAPALAAAPDLAVNLHGRGPQSHAAVLACRPGALVAFACREVPQSWSGPQWREDEHERARWARLVSAAGWPASPDDVRLPLPAVPPPAEAVGATLVHPGAAYPARTWPATRFAAVARAEFAAGRRVVVTGSAAERELAETVARHAGLPPSTVLAGRTDLATLAAAVASADRVVCGDTGVAHLATAFGTPSVIVFGPVPPRRWGPPPGGPHRVLWGGETGDGTADVAHPALLRITVADVLAALATLPPPGAA